MNGSAARTSGARAVALAAVGLASLLAGCPKPLPVVKATRFAGVRTPIERLAVMPFYPWPTTRQGAPAGGVTGADAAARIARMLTEAIQERGIEVIPGADLELAFTARGEVTPRLDAPLAAEVAARKFGAQAVLLGEVMRYRDRGESFAGTEPHRASPRDERDPVVRYRESSADGTAAGTVGSSVAFTVTLYEAPSGRRLWRAKFNETQRALSSELRNVRRYPGRGTRWLTAGELARWGIRAAAEAMPLGR